MNYCDIGSAEIAYEVFGNGSTTIVIDTCIASCSAEWQHIAEELSKQYRVLIYDRAGYGISTISKLERTPENIATELNMLLTSLSINSNIILVGHSQGGLYAVQYALMFKERVKGLVLLDPATPFDLEFKKILTQDEYKNSGIDKTGNFRLAYKLTSMHLGFVFKQLLKKSPPFYYCRYSKEAENYILKALCNKNTYKTALCEYDYTHNGIDTEGVADAIKKTGLMDLPVKIITHSSAIYVNELKQYCRIETQTAEKIESVWQEIMKRYMKISYNSENMQAPNSGHYIHLTDFNILKDTIVSIL